MPSKCKVCGTSGNILLQGDRPPRGLSGRLLAAGEATICSGLISNRPLEVLRDLVLAHVLGQVADPQVPRLAHHPAVGRRLGSRQAGLPGAVPPLPSSHSHLGEEERGREQRRRHRRRVRGHHHSLLRFQSLQRRETDSLLHIEPFPILYYISLRCVVRAKCARLLHLLSLLRFSLD